VIRRTISFRTVAALLLAMAMLLGAESPVGASNADASNAGAHRSAASCIHPVSVRVNSHGDPNGGGFNIATTNVYVKPPYFDTLISIGVASRKPGARIISLTGRNSDGKNWVGYRAKANKWRHNSYKPKHVHIQWFVARGCLG
jgi:hypothetical protein